MGKKRWNRSCKKKQDFYFAEKNDEPNQEPALIYADGAEYLEAHKGAVALYQLSRTLGEERFNATLLQWTKENGGRPVRFFDLYQKFLKESPKEKRERIRKLFETTEPVSKSKLLN